jgi:hypothetical protein
MQHVQENNLSTGRYGSSYMQSIKIQKKHDTASLSCLRLRKKSYLICTSVCQELNMKYQIIDIEENKSPMFVKQNFPAKSTSWDRS